MSLKIQIVAPRSVNKTLPDFWVSHSIRCLSFHEEPGFFRIELPDTGMMWGQVMELLNRGYRVK